MLYIAYIQGDKMRTLFAMHCITKRNLNDNYYDEKLKSLGYDDTNLPEDQIPSERDLATGQVDESLIEKGRFQAKLLAEQVKAVDFEVKRIYCADQKRCKETAQIIAENIGYPCEIITDNRLNARGYGKIADEAMDIDKLKHFWLHKDVITNVDTMQLILYYLVAPEKIGAESKSKFKARLNSFIQDPSIDFNDALVVAGSDVWKRIKKDNIFYAYKDEDKADLRRGQLAQVDFTREKEQKTRKDKDASADMAR